MAEVLATMVVGPLVSMVKDKASSILLDQYKVMDGMEEQHKLLKRKLPAVLDVITDAEEQAANNREGAKAWLEEVRNVAHKANDVLDEFKYEALRRKAKAEGHYKEFGMDVIKLFPSHNRFVFRYRMANKLRMILQEIDVLIAEMNTFRFKFKPLPPMSLKWRQTDPSITKDSVNIASESRANDKKKIVDTLLGRGDNVSLTVLPIVGMGGMGKTTLAQLVYSDMDIQRHFQVRLWVCVSENFDVDSLAERIVEEAKKNGCQPNGSTTLEKLQTAFSGKRYLLVLDDVWNRESEKWGKLRSYLQHGGTGSSVITTTRDGNVAQLMGTIEGHKIKGLDINIIEKIIKKGAFGSQEEVPTKFKTLVGDVAKRCAGSPLAATALGSALLTKNTVQEWEAILNRSTICDEENGILPILKLSYNSLPAHMRQCFAFCAMFPKDHEIGVEMLIQLWMANSFIPEQKGVCIEVTGKQIFNELAQRSFFQEVQQDDLYTKATCKIHDLMHDVAQDSMGTECATIDTKPSQSEDFSNSARHLYLSVDVLGNVLNGSPEKESLAIQTLICDGSTIPDVQHLSKYCRSVRAIKTKQGSLLEPKYIHHLRYLDLSGSGIEALPENITILYHLQTLNLSSCESLRELPKTMKYMTALRHLYTDRCWQLQSMPPDLRHITSLRTLTSFVVGTGSGCSNMGELQNLDLGARLELRQLQNATGADAKEANVWDKKRLEELTLIWDGDLENEEAHKEVLEGLRPHDGLKSLSIYFCSSSSTPTWMLGMQGMVNLVLSCCKTLKNLPPLWQLPSLELLYLNDLPNLHCLFSGGAPSKFEKLKTMTLEKMPKFETWWDMNEVQGEEPLFPKVEYLSIKDCEKLKTLPKASISVVKQSYGKDDTNCRSPFPALTEMKLCGLKDFCRWEDVEGTQGEDGAFIQYVNKLSNTCEITFPRLEKLGVTTFPLLEKLEVVKCMWLTTFPEAPKLCSLELQACGQQAALQAASRYITSLSSLNLTGLHNAHMTEGDWVHDYGSRFLGDLVVVCDHQSPFPLGSLSLRACDLFFSHSSAPALWNCFGQLSHLEIGFYDGLVYWPEKLFQGLVSLRTLYIQDCSNLTGRTEEEASDEQSAPEQSGGHLPCLLSLLIQNCGSLVQVPILSSASLKALRILSCQSLKSVVFGEQTRRLLVSGEGAVQAQPAETTSSSSLTAAGSPSSSREEATVSAALVLKPVSSSSASSPNHYSFFPCLQILAFDQCGGLTEVANIPPSMKAMVFLGCGSLVSLSGEVPSSLEQLTICNCECLESLPNGTQQAYSSLRILKIEGCPGTKQLPPSLRQRLGHLEEEDLDRHLQGPQNATFMSKLVCFRPRSQD